LSWWPIATKPAASPNIANRKSREAALAKSSRVSLEGLAEQIKAAGTKELNVILKGDVQGSVEVITDLLTKLSNDKVRLKLLRSGVGAITETDVLLASASNAIIIGFNVRPERKAQEIAEQEKSTSACTRSFTNCRTRSSAP
jgi:translation initiation factor IF-2